MRQKLSLLTKTMLLLGALMAGSGSAWGDTAGFTLTSSAGSSATGTIAGTQSESWAYSATFTNGATASTQNSSWQVGSSSKPCSKLVLSTSGITGTITKIDISCGTQSGKGTVNCTVGGNNFGTQGQAAGSGNTPSSYGTTPSFSGSASGEIVITINNTGTYISLKSVTVTYTTGGGGGNVVAQPTFSVDGGAIAAGTTVSLIQNDADEIRYTTDGTTPTKTTGTVYSSPITITTATTIKAIAIKDNVESAVATAEYTISVTSPTFSLSGGSYMQGTTFTITSEGNNIYYTTDESTPSASSTAYTGPIAISSTESTTYKAIAIDNYGNKSSVTTRTYTAKAPATLPFSWTGTSANGKSNLSSQTGVVLSLATDYATSNAPYRLKFDGTNRYVTIYTNEKPLDVTFTAKIFSGTSTGSKMKVQASADGINFTDIEEFKIDGGQDETFVFTTKNAFAENHRAVKLSLSYKDQNVAVGTISISSSSKKITLASACTDGTNYYGTYSNNYAFVVPAADYMTVSAISVAAGKLVVTNYAEGDIVKANTGVMVSSTTDGEKTISLTTATGTEIDGNMLKASGDAGIDAATMGAGAADGTKFYRLTMHNGTDIGFWWGAQDGAAFAIGPNKAYLEVPASAASARMQGLWFEGDAQDIDTVRREAVDNNGMAYDLQGRRVAQPTKGLYIVNGKKVIIK